MIFFLGSPLIDIIANVSKDFLEKYRLKPDNTVRATPELEPIFQEIIKFNPIVQVGGSVVNSARLFQWVSKKSHLVIVSGCIGSDEYGKLINVKLTEEDIHSQLFEIPNVATGVVAVLLTDQNRAMVTHLGASRCFSMKQLDQNLWKILHKTDYFYFSAFSLGTCFDVIDKICKYFNDTKKTVIMNLAADFLSTKFPQEMVYLFENSDIVFGNEEEYRALYNINNVEEVFDHELLQKLNAMYFKKPYRLLVMTRGGNPLYVLNEGKLKDFEVLSVNKDKIVDTDGAGDAFVAGFLAQYIKNKDIPDCVKCGLWTSSEVIQQHGCNFDKNKVYENCRYFYSNLVLSYWYDLHQ